MVIDNFCFAYGGTCLASVPDCGQAMLAKKIYQTKGSHQ